MTTRSDAEKTGARQDCLSIPGGPNYGCKLTHHPPTDHCSGHGPQRLGYHGDLINFGR